jgi:hypothetical protein
MEQQLQTAMHSEDRHKDRNHSSFENEREILM